MQWAKVLLDVPELRGAVPLAKLRPLLSLLRHTGTAISSDNAALLAMVMDLAPNEPTHVEVDDLLYRHGLIAPRTARNLLVAGGIGQTRLEVCRSASPDHGGRAA
jgi:hypothetical protein